MKKISFFLVLLFLLLCASRLFAITGTINDQFRIEPDGQGDLKITGMKNEEVDANDDIANFVKHLANGDVTILPGQQTNEIVLILPNQESGVLITATAPGSTAQNFNAAATITYFIQQATLPDAQDGNNHGLNQFTFLNVITQPAVLHEINQVYTEGELSNNQIPVPGNLVIGEQGSSVNNHATLLGNNNEGGINITVSGTEENDDLSQPTVTVTSLSTEQVATYRETRRVSLMSRTAYLAYLSRKLCSRNFYSQCWNSVVGRFQRWRGGEHQDVIESYDKEGGWGSTLKYTLLMAIIATEAGASKAH